MNYYNDFVLPVFKGEYDEYLDGMIDTIQKRKRDMAPKIWEFQVGEIVKYNMATNPKYLRGAQGTIRKINRTKVVIDLDHPHGRFHRGITTPLTMIEKVN
jgi:hypothetical protein